MRDILNKLDFLTESRGLAGRKPGDVFMDPADGETITFQELMYYPEGGGKYDKNQLPQIWEQLKSLSVVWQNEVRSTTGGFIIARFEHEEIGPLYYGFAVTEVKPNPLDNKLPNKITSGTGSFQFAGAAAAKVQAKLTPQDLLSNKLNLSIKDIMLQLSETLGTDSPLYAVAHHVAMGHPLPTSINATEDLSFTAFRDYFCEILQPMALQNGLYTGNAGEAAEIFLGPNGFAGTTISFDDSKNAGLSDSVLETSDGKYVKISSKGEKGAEASVKNLLDEVQKVQSQELLEKYSEVIQIINDVKSAGQAGAPLMLGIKYGIIDEADAEFIKSLKKFIPVPLTSLKDVNVQGMEPSKNIIKLANNRTTKNPNSVALYYHLMAAVAHEAADKVNKGTNFSQAASDILNNGALVQVYTNAKQSGDQWTLEGFKTVYPSKAVTGVVLSAGKNYSSTDIKGNFTFKILRNGAKAEMLDDEKIESGKEPTPPELATVAKDITEPRVIGKQKPQTPNIGRSKRPSLR
jgi:hypothetical protein